MMQEGMMPQVIRAQVVEEDIPFGERVTLAIQRFVTMIANGIIALLLAPVFFFRTLFTTKREVVRPVPFGRGLPGPMPMKMDINIKQPETDEPWKKEHDDIYGTDEDGNPHN